MNVRNVLPQRTDESIYVFSRSYFLAFLPWLGMGFALLVIGLIMVFVVTLAFPQIGLDPLSNDIFVLLTSAYFLLIIPFLTVAFIDFYYDLHIVTDRRLIDIDQHALFSREINELALEEVQDVGSENKGVLGSVFDYGDVVIETAGAEERFRFHNVLHPREVASIILDLSDQAKQRLENGGLQEHLEPRGQFKGVIDGKVYDTTQPLEDMGAVVPHDPRIHPDIVTAPTPGVHTTQVAESPLEPLAEPTSQTSVPAVQSAPANPLQNELPPGGVPLSPPTLGDLPSDLDIVIDEPNQQPPKK